MDNKALIEQMEREGAKKVHVEQGQQVNVQISRYSHGGQIRIDFGGVEVSRLDITPQDARGMAQQLIRLANVIDLNHSKVKNLGATRRTRKARRKRSRASRKRR